MIQEDRMSEEEIPGIVREADAVYESVRAICHEGRTHPAPRSTECWGT